MTTNLSYALGFAVVFFFFAAKLRRSRGFTLPDFMGDRFDSRLLRGWTALVVAVTSILYLRRPDPRDGLRDGAPSRARVLGGPARRHGNLRRVRRSRWVERRGLDQRPPDSADVDRTPGPGAFRVSRYRWVFERHGASGSGGSRLDLSFRSAVVDRISHLLVPPRLHRLQHEARALDEGVRRPRRGSRAPRHSVDRGHRDRLSRFRRALSGRGRPRAGMGLDRVAGRGLSGDDCDAPRTARRRRSRSPESPARSCPRPIPFF